MFQNHWILSFYLYHLGCNEAFVLAQVLVHLVDLILQDPPTAVLNTVILELHFFHYSLLQVLLLLQLLAEVRENQEKHQPVRPGPLPCLCALWCYF